MDLTLLNVIEMARAVTPIVERQGGGSIVNMSSYTALTPFPGGSVGEALRNALAAWTKMYADVYGPKGIRMNNVLPGWMENIAGGRGDGFIPDIPLCRLRLMKEVGAVVAFLASEGRGVHHRPEHQGGRWTCATDLTFRPKAQNRVGFDRLPTGAEL